MTKIRHASSVLYSLFPHFPVFLAWCTACSVLCLSSLVSVFFLVFSASVTISDLVSSGFGSWAALTWRLSLPLLYSARGRRSEQLRVSVPSEVDTLHREPSEGDQDWHGTCEKALRRAGGCVINTPHVDHEVGRTRLLLILLWLCLHEPELLFWSLQLITYYPNIL